MQELDLSFNQLHGEMQDSFGNMSYGLLGSLEYLSLRENLISGHLTEQFGEFMNLRYLVLAYNSLSGAIPLSFGNISSLERLWLKGNNFTGNIPKSFGQLSNLVESNIENNKLEGIVTESHFANLSRLKYFIASGNHVTLDVSQHWIAPIQLELGSWNLGKGSEMPSWLQVQRNMKVLDISNTGISGTIPPWFLNIFYLNVSLNNLHGKLPRMSSTNFSGSLTSIIIKNVKDLSHNFFSGGISHLLCGTAHNFVVFVLEGNRFSGHLPDCWNKWSNLQVLKLGNNRMSGSIPMSIWSLENLLSLSLYGNKFSGHIPSTDFNCKSLMKIDLSHNNLDGSIPAGMGTSLVKLKILILRSNKLSGEISPEICNLQNLQILDLANNQFSGVIPRCISNFTSMATKRMLNHFFERASIVSNDFLQSHRLRVHAFQLNSILATEIESASIVTKGVELEYSTTLSLVTSIDLSVNNLSGAIPNELTSLVELRSLNLSENNFTGSIPQNIGAMKQLESLDFSQNSLSGQIPNSLRLLSSLNHLNLSFNKWIGRIPESTQLRTLDASSFIGNDLCGPPLNNCSSGGNGHEKGEKEGDDKPEIEFLYVFLSLGYAVGFSAACTTLLLKKSWRDAYFRMLECIWDKIYVYLYVKWRRLARQAASTSPR